MKKILTVAFLFLFAFGSVTVMGTGIYIYAKYSAGLPEINTIEDYDPKKVSMVYDRNGELIGQFFDVEKRRVRSKEEIPDYVEKAFMAAEDSEFYNHSGINYRAILRAAIKNFMVGRTVQGGSTITQQVVKKIFLSDERSLKRKIKEAILAKRLERAYPKDKILNLYLNHIYLGEGAYGVEVAAQTYFRKSVEELEIKEAALLAGLTNRPSKNTPLKNPKVAKRRQLYVLNRMAEEDYITEEEARTAAQEELQVFFPRALEKDAPYFLESLRQVVTENVGNKALLQDGLKIITSLDLQAQRAAQKAIQRGLRELDKRQGFRGSLKKLRTREEVQEFLYQVRNEQIKKFNQSFVIDRNGEVIGKIKDPLNLTVYTIGSEIKFKPNLPNYIQVGDMVEAVVTKVSDKEKIVFVRFGEHRGVILFETMKWARKPNPNVIFKSDQIKQPSYALKKGDVIVVKIVKENIEDEEVLKTKSVEFIQHHAVVELEQEPLAQGALLSFDLKTGDIIAMVGGYDFEKSKYNRTYQALRQTGSAFKPLVYASALDYGFNPVSEILDVPMVFEEEVPVEESEESKESKNDNRSKKGNQSKNDNRSKKGNQSKNDNWSKNDNESKEREGRASGDENSKSKEVQIRKYKPTNHSKDFSGDVIFRDALVRSLNVPTMQIMNKIKVPWVLTYAQRLGVFSPLNEDITLALGSSGLTLYEITKAYSHFARLGKEITPLLIRSVENEEGEILMSNYSLDEKFSKEIQKTKEDFKTKVVEEMRFGDQFETFQLPATDATTATITATATATASDPNGAATTATATASDPNGAAIDCHRN